MTAITTFARYILKIIKRRSYVVHDDTNLVFQILLRWRAVSQARKWRNVCHIALGYSRSWDNEERIIESCTSLEKYVPCWTCHRPDHFLQAETNKAQSIAVLWKEWETRLLFLTAKELLSSGTIVSRKTHNQNALPCLRSDQGEAHNG